MGHALMENRNGLVVDATLTRATGTAEREAALTMLDRRKGKGRIPLGADKAHDVADFVGALRTRNDAAHRGQRRDQQDRQAAQNRTDSTPGSSSGASPCRWT
jgi:hypothetical protein